MLVETCVTAILQNVFTLCQGNKCNLGELRQWNTAECVYLLPGKYAALENCVSGTLHDVFTFCRGNIYCHGELRRPGILQNVFTFCQANNFQSRRTTSLEYCRICLPSVRAIYYRYGELRHWNIAECVTEIVQNVFTFCQGNNMYSHGELLSLDYCRICLPSVRAIYYRYGELRH